VEYAPLTEYAPRCPDCKRNDRVYMHLPTRTWRCDRCDEVLVGMTDAEVVMAGAGGRLSYVQKEEP